ncbi:MAG: PQQ-binding-like beta-propeller repeat protein [Candidatus Omnitrophica bacterium]|nr:PQQ-binding-like beta-propeller repeat protein [Candidatus Omnitrophota bacterium]
MMKKIKNQFICRLRGMNGLAIIGVLQLGILLSASAVPTHVDILDTIGAKRGICVLLCENPADLAIDLAQASEMLIFIQTPDDEEILQMRQKIDSAGLLNSRIYISKGGTEKIHLADNIADAAVIEKCSDQEQLEIFRVLHPQGKLITNNDVAIKPVPEGVDQWTHPYHGPDNNPQSEDRIAKSPYLTQFLAKPYYGPMPEVTVASNGRLFKAFGHISFKKREWAMLNKLAAMNAFNGVILWERDLTPGFMIHRNTMIASPDTLYLADNESCKLIDAETGRLRDEIFFPRNESDLWGWKWMALVNDVLYVLLGEPDIIDEVLRGTKETAGWPWTGLGENYDKFGEDYPWGFGHILAAIDVHTKKVIWRREEEKMIDSRALVMKGGRIYAYSHQNYLAAVNARDGSDVWRTTDSELMDAIGRHDRAQTWTKGYSSQIYLTAGDNALYFAGPQRTKLVAASMDDGRILWTYEDGNSLLVLRDNVVYAMNRNSPSKKFDANTGEIIADLPSLRGNCTRATGAFDSVFARGDQHGGTLRMNVSDDTACRLPAMRPACQDGVIPANGLLYWGPWMCDCNHSLVGIICLSPAGLFDFSQSAEENERLEIEKKQPAAASPPPLNDADWFTYRKDNQRTSSTTAFINNSIRKAWEFQPHTGIVRTAPITAAGLTFFSGSDGIVYALDNQTGRQQWKSFTGGRVFFPPCYWEGRLYVGSADGWIYAFEAAGGKRLWRFRAAPVERNIPVYGELSSTWPATCVLVENGVIYAGAGIVSHDGTHIYALDARSGKLIWQNNHSGRLMGEEKFTGVSVQGHMLLHDGKLYMAGGNAVSPAIYDASTGECLNALENEWQKAPRGKDLYLINNKVHVFDQMLYSPRGYIPSRYYANYLLHAGSKSDPSFWAVKQEIMCVTLQNETELKAVPIWRKAGFIETVAMAIAQNALVAAGGVVVDAKTNSISSMLTGLNRSDGEILFQKELPALPASWGLAIDRDGRIIVATDEGHVICYK